MTAFAREEIRSWQLRGNAVWELRSVNHRFLDTSLRLPEDFRALEPRIRGALTQGITRGKVECQLKVQLAQTNALLEINQELVDRLVLLNRNLAQTLGQAATINTFDMLRWPGVMEAPLMNSGAIEHDIMEGLERAIAELIGTREREGEKIATVILERSDDIAIHTQEVKQRLPVVIKNQRERLNERLKSVLEELDPNRLEQEMLIFLQKTDVAEELDRLDSHLIEVHRVLKGQAPAGRRLDFLMQELNREANTLGSKSNDAEVTNRAIHIKVLIEQMREQIQNIE